MWLTCLLGNDTDTRCDSESQIGPDADAPPSEMEKK